MKQKNVIWLFVTNIISYIIFLFLRYVLKNDGKNNENRESILFINTGQIGDLIVSTILIENEDIFGEENLYILIKDDYENLFNDYTGKFKILTYNYRKYKWSVLYRINLLKKLRKLKFKQTYNITAARGMLNDELSLLSGANEVFAMYTDFIFIKGIIKNKMTNKYTNILFKGIKNEYDKHISLLKIFSSNEVFFGNRKIL